MQKPGQNRLSGNNRLRKPLFSGQKHEWHPLPARAGHLAFPPIVKNWRAVERRFPNMSERVFTHFANPAGGAGIPDRLGLPEPHP